MREPGNITQHELIGLKAEIKESKNKSLTGLKGKVIDETRNMLKIETEKGEKEIPKKDCTFSFKLDDKKVQVEGRLLVGRPEDRIKRKVK